MKTKTFTSNKKLILLISIVAIMILAITAGTTIAFLKAETGTVTNTFTPAKVTTDITEGFDGKTKSNVQIKNTGDINAYIRAAVVVNWVDDDGNIYPKQPVAGEDNDYTITYNLVTSGDGWYKIGDYYYYSKPVPPKDNEPNNVTGVLITECKPVEGKAPDGCYLSVEIIADAIQSVPLDAIQDAWSVTVNDDGSVTTYTKPVN